MFMDRSSPRGPFETYVVSSEGGSLQRLLPAENGPHIDANWSPDGRRLVFSTSDSERNGREDYGLRILDVASNKVTPVPGSEGVLSPRWSPDGRYIAGIGKSGEGLKVLDLETQRWSVLQKEGLDFPTFSQDSKFIYFDRWVDGVFRVRVTGGEAERIADLKGFHQTGSVGVWMGLDPTDTPMLLRDAGTEDIYALTLEEK